MFRENAEFLMKHLVLGLFLFFGLAHNAQAMQAPKLSAAYAAPPVWVAKQAQEAPVAPTADDLEKAEETTAPTDAARMAMERERYDRGRSLHRTGNVMFGVGAGAFVPSLYAFMVGLFSDQQGLATAGALGLIGSVGAFYTGGILSSVGAMNSTRAVNRALGLNISTASSIIGLVATGVSLFLVPVAGPVIAVICGVVQMSRARAGLRSVGLADVRIAPTGQGIALQARF